MKLKDLKKKVSAKVAKGKKRVAKKCGRARKATAVAVTVALVASLFAGCQNPAQRAQSQTIQITAYGSARVSFGSEAATLAQSNETGGNDAGQVATPSNPITPEIAVGVGGSSAGVGKGTATQSGKFATIGAGVDAAASMVPASSSDGASSSEGAAPSESAASAAPICEGGACCPDGACRE